MQIYKDLLADIMNNGDDAEYRNGVRRSVFGRQLRFNLQEEFPLVNTHKCFFRGMVEETLWIIGGGTNANQLRDVGVNIWEQWALRVERAEELNASVIAAYPETADVMSAEGIAEVITKGVPTFQGSTEPLDGELGPIYGAQWRQAGGGPTHHAVYRKILPEDVFEDRLSVFKKHYDEHVSEIPVSFEDFVTSNYHQQCDQLNELVMRLRHNPNHTGMVVSSWNPKQLPYDGITPAANVLFGRMALSPCHTLFQAYVRSPREPNGKRRLSLQLYQRSCDVPVGFPFNIAQYALLTHMLAAVCDMEPDELVWTGGNIHVYGDQMDLVRQELEVQPATSRVRLVMTVPENRDLTSFKASDFSFEGYDPQSSIRYPVSE